MTLIAGIGFLDEAYLISDSRISFLGGLKAPEDKLMKVFQIAPKMLIAFTSDHVDFTLEVLRRISVYSLNTKVQKKAMFILPHLIRKAKYEYNSLLKESKIKKPPRMEFIYCGVVNKPQMFSSYFLFELIKQKKGSFRVPEKISKALRDRGEGIWSLDPPAPIIYKQMFPDNPKHEYIYLGYATGGSGQDIYYEIEKEYLQFFDWDSGLTKGIILENIVNEYIKKNNIQTIGGIVQVWRVNKDGITPVCYEEKRHNGDNTETKLKRLEFTKDGWSLSDYTNNTISQAKPMKSCFNTTIPEKKVGNTSTSNY